MSARIDGSWVSSDDQSDCEPVNDISALNTSATALGCSPLKFSKISQRNISSYAKSKCDSSI